MLSKLKANIAMVLVLILEIGDAEKGDLNYVYSWTYTFKSHVSSRKLLKLLPTRNAWEVSPFYEKDQLAKTNLKSNSLSLDSLRA